MNDKLKPCPFCGSAPELVDDRTSWFVRCNHCKPFATVIYGETVSHLDHADDAGAFLDVDWMGLRQTAIAAWNTRTADALEPSGDAVERVAELQLAAFLAGRGSVTSMKYGTRIAKPGPTMDDFRGMAKAALTHSAGN